MLKPIIILVAIGAIGLVGYKVGRVKLEVRHKPPN
ncbi:hypothetical protein F962_02013 [Acinetobacter baumannii NIPH 190]|nr:hypothetical protein F962_02013 [Acinetobacter baumannii NIPH 190]